MLQNIHIFGTSAEYHNAETVRPLSKQRFDQTGRDRTNLCARISPVISNLGQGRFLKPCVRRALVGRAMGSRLFNQKLERSATSHRL